MALIAPHFSGGTIPATIRYRVRIQVWRHRTRVPTEVMEFD